MSNRAKPKNHRRPAWVEMFAKTRGGGDVADGRDWHTDVPNIKLSRAFVVVLVLHVVAVGGILAFELFKPEGGAAAKPEGEPAKPILTADTPAPPAPEPETPAARREAERGGYESYIVQAGDSIRTVASQYGISRTELLAANRIDEQHPLVAGRLLRIPKALLPGGWSANSQAVSTGPDTRTQTPEISPRIEAEDHTVLPVPEPLEIAEEDDGFQPLISPPVSPTPTPQPDPAPAAETGTATETGTAAETATGTAAETGTAEATGTAAGTGVASTSPSYQPATPDPDGEDAPLKIVAPEPEKKPRVSRTVPADPPATADTATAGRSHTVVAGETLYRISRRYGVTVDAILAANPGVQPSTLAIGKKLRIP